MTLFHNIKRYHFLRFCLSLIVIIALLGCNKISPDPKEGAVQLYETLSKCAESGDLKKANSVMSDYWNNYDDEQRKVFLLSLREKFVTNDEVVRFIVEPSFHEYPMCGIYMKNLNKVAFEEAKSQLNEIAETSDKSNYNGSPASKAILLGMLLAESYDANDMDLGYESIKTVYDDLKNESFYYRVEFADAFKEFIDDSGELGIKAYEFLFNRFEGGIKDDFLKLLLESKPDYD